MWTNPRYTQLVQEGKPSYLDPEVEVKFIPAPIGGWDAISPLATMDPKYAVVLDNAIARPGWIEPRGGASSWCTGLNGPIETLMAYRPQTIAEKLFAAVRNTIVDVSVINAPATVLSGLSNNRWQYVNVKPAGSASYLAMVNGTDPYTTYNGANWQQQPITGVVSSTFINIMLFNRRIWFVQNNSSVAWYLGTDSISGAATSFDVGSFFTKGGYLMAMGDWTVDGGSGPNDYLVFVSNKGQAVVYAGTNPAVDFTLVGVFDLPDVISRRCFCRIGSDLALITLQGLIPLSQALPFNPSGVRSVALTNRIQNAMLLAAQSYNNNFGWQCMLFPLQSLMLLNIPVQENATQIQYVMNPMNGSWCRFTGWNANNFEIFNDSLYFGDNSGNVNLAYAGTQDLGVQIPLNIECAFNYLDSPNRIKNISMIRPFMNIDQNLTVQLGINVDFAPFSQSAPVNELLLTNVALWDVALWDSATWPQIPQPVTNWFSAQALGTALAVQMTITLGSTTPSGIQYTQSGAGLSQIQLNMFEVISQFGGPI